MGEVGVILDLKGMVKKEVDGSAVEEMTLYVEMVEVLMNDNQSML